VRVHVLEALRIMKLNLCCGTNVFPSWLNVDRTDLEQDYLRHLREAPPGFVWPPEQQRVADAVLAGKLEFMRHDVRGDMSWFLDNSADAIYLGQCIEHFNRRTEAPRLLKECLRILKPKGLVRLTTPDLNRLLLAADYGGFAEFAKEQPAFFATAHPDDQLAYLMFGASGDSCTMENYEGHFHCYSGNSLGALLESLGYVAITEAPNFRHPHFHDTVDFGMTHSFAMEAVKP
jgi:SAM-dependent methyltransferase